MTCDTIVKEKEEEDDEEESDEDIARMCVLDEFRNRRETCETCQLSIVNVSCIAVIPENEEPMGITGDELERRIEEFASKRLEG